MTCCEIPHALGQQLQAVLDTCEIKVLVIYTDELPYTVFKVELKHYFVRRHGDNDVGR